MINKIVINLETEINLDDDQLTYIAKFLGFKLNTLLEYYNIENSTNGMSVDFEAENGATILSIID